ncbi:hypothetical protein [Kordiimonas sp.]|uniref:hypothetical protein n=1 Tax=Kordiimonas sp. TaxID=1970157 RepID=UPI003A8FB7D2
MSKTLLVTAIALGSSVAPAIAVSATQPQAGNAQDQLEKDREFARKLRELKDRQHREWNELMDEQRAEVAELKGKTPEEQRKALDEHTNEKRDMKMRHQKELEELKAEYKG